MDQLYGYLYCVLMVPVFGCHGNIKMLGERVLGMRFLPPPGSTQAPTTCDPSIPQGGEGTVNHHGDTVTRVYALSQTPTPPWRSGHRETL